uniref:Uncharacterized protein n=1 Tax=Fagus sylvatica TaxID=28930 RepID=A0A2N9I3U6_FAGSY
MIKDQDQDQIRSRSRSDQIRSRSRSDQIRSRSRSDQIRSRFDPEIGAGMLDGPSVRWLRCDGDGGFGASREIGERESEVARGWLGMSWAREKARWLGVLGVARGGSGWLAGWLGVARDSEKESREQRVRREREEMREMGRSRAPSRVLENGLRKIFP